MKKIGLLISLLMCGILFTGCFEKNKEIGNEDKNHVYIPEQMISDCKNMIKNEFGNTEYEFSGDINYHSGVYFDYSIVTGSVYFNYKTRPFLCLYEGDKSIIDIVDYVKDDGEIIDLSYLQSLYNDLSQENWDEQRTNAESIFDLLVLHKEFKEKYINKETAGMRTIIRDIAFQNGVTEDDLVDSDNYYNQVLDIRRQKYNQIPFYQKEYYVELINKLLSEKGIQVYCSASVCDEITFSGNYASQENLQNLVNDVTSVITALYANGIVFNGDFETNFPINFYYDEYIRKIDPEIITNPEGTPSIEKLDDVVAICHNNSINCGIDCEDWNVTNKSYILPYKDGYIGYDYGGNGEGWGYYLTYKSIDNPCDNVISITDEIFFWHTRYAYHKETFGNDEHPDDRVYINQGLRGGGGTDEVAKVLDCVAGKDIMEDDSCKREVDKYMYNLIVGNEQNEYFTRWMNKFKEDIDNDKFTPPSFRASRRDECIGRYKFEDLLQKDGKINSQLTDKEREYYNKIQSNNLHKCAMEYLDS